MVLSPIPNVPLNPKLGIKNPHLEIVAKRLKMDENVNRTHLRTHWPTAKQCHERFRPSRKCVNADCARYLRSSNDLMPIVIVLLFIVILLPPLYSQPSIGTTAKFKTRGYASLTSAPSISGFPLKHRPRSSCNNDQMSVEWSV